MAVDDLRSGTWVTYIGGRATSARLRRCRVEVIAGPDAGLVRDIEASVIRIGARRGNDVQLTDSKVSGLHCEIRLDDRGYRPDLAGWRRERVPALPRQRPMTIRPDWICEIVSESNRSTDTIKKVRRYHQAGVPHYWILDEVARALTVHRHGPDGYVIALVAEAHELVRPEPFDAIEVKVASLFGDDADD